ncbi:MAG: efflux RND transporter permease subunit [Gluconobacter potus]|uniref:Multidrug transporter subunit MdtC n=1 Tax=Gluconobacter potus TaxID=2724927 RepID=A0ABR9YPE1_9PROT|nr:MULTISPECIES: efflux RND transporter permease subunit [Gluconobacter]MBF0865650.1 multidrug transporter subunit MdtC [Gluconobacter sp. R71656]MBF0868566.1 multidrug transporter subunit MdtC [Gluconobacter sp. R75628]MBF0874605.1 multidrug transporter subunit MdtC [Gluconobacter sp. R75629]MBF0883680.1 multidrug transporter subunit MdtC [Gluconobacter potus]
MNPSRLFIQRPVATTLLMLALLLAGMIGYRFLPISALPEVDYPTIVVRTFYPGASSDVMMTSVTAPLEDQMGEMAGLDQMTSQSSAGASVITLRFALTTSLDVAEQEVQEAINAANSLLPSALPAPPIYSKVNPADTPVLILGVTSDTLPLTEVEDYVATRLQQKISEISGVGEVSLSGGNKKAYRVQVNVQKATSYGLDMDTLRTTIGNVNVNSPTGSFNGTEQARTIRLNSQISSTDQLMNQVVGWSSTTKGPVRLKNIATVIEAPEDTQLAGWANTTPAIILNIRRQPSANILSTVNAIKTALPRLEQDMPAGIHITALTDRTTTIRASVSDVEFELTLALVLVVAVIFVFLHDPAATMVPALSVPLSIVGTLAVMQLMGFSLDNLSLMSLTIATGFVVDDAIVMIENIARYIEMGKDRMTAALEGAGEIGFTIISLTVSLIAVLIPLLFMSDVIGRLFYEFAVTLAVTIIISAIVSLTLVPMMCARVLKDEAHQTTKPKWALKADQLINGLISAYDRGLVHILRHQTATLLFFVFTLALTGVLVVVIPKGLFPNQDTGVIQGVSVMDSSISFDAMKALQQRLGAAILKDPDVASLSSYIGVDGDNTTLNRGRFQITLRDHDKRSLSASKISARILNEVSSIPGTQLYLQPVQDLTLNTNVSATQYQFLIEDSDSSRLSTWSDRLVAEMQKSPALADVTSDLQAQGLAEDVTLDRATGARFSITPETVDNLLYDSFGQRQISTIYTQSNQYRVILEASPGLQNTPDSLDKLYMAGSASTGTVDSGPTRTPTSGLVPLSAVTKMTPSTAPLLITHVAQFPATTVSFNVAPGYSLGAATSAIDAARAKLKMPDTVQTSFIGTAAVFENSMSNEAWLVVAALVAVYIVLGVLYESFIHPLTILSTLPSAAIGALLILWITGSGLDVMGVIGIVLLIGIVKKNAIMMIDFALEAERVEGLSPVESITKAAHLRFRPILMTTLAAMLGAVPMVIGSGVGSELRRPLGYAIVGGLMVSQLLTLFTTPVIYLFMERIRLRVSRLRQHRASSTQGAS